MMTFLHLLDDSKDPIFIFCRFFGPGHLRGPGVSLGRILGVLSIEPFLGEGGGLARGLYRPPPPQLQALLPLDRTSTIAPTPTSPGTIYPTLGWGQTPIGSGRKGTSIPGGDSSRGATGELFA